MNKCVPVVVFTAPENFIGVFVSFRITFTIFNRALKFERYFNSFGIFSAFYYFRNCDVNCDQELHQISLRRSLNSFPYRIPF